MAAPLLLDTDVLIDYLRARSEAITYIESRGEVLLMSAITVAELYAGVREGTERAALDALVRAFRVLPVDDEIAINGGLHRRDYYKSHSIGLADALIVATAVKYKAVLVTLNAKHFPMLPNTFMPYQKV